MTSLRYLHLDVFTSRPFAGNQLAVFPDARGLDVGAMSRIAREINFSETTFVLPSEQPGTDVRMRIFTPAREVPMAGHPTVGSTFALAHEGRIAVGRRDFVFGLGVGPTPVELEWTGGTLDFVWMTQQRPEFGRAFTHIDQVARALGVEPNDIGATGLPVQPVSCGLTFLLVPLTTREAVDRVVLDERQYVACCDHSGVEVLPAYVFSTEAGPDEAAAYSRMLAPAFAFGVPEDPATGSASGPLGCFLVQYGVVSPAQALRLVNVQGVKMGRPSAIAISIEAQGATVTRVRVGGSAVLVAEGVFRVC